MNSLLTKFKNRELQLIVVAIIMLILFLLSLFVLNSYKKYNLSIKNLNKEKMDYEYVFKQAKSLTQSVKFEVLDAQTVNNIIATNMYNGITDIAVKTNDNKIIVMFSSSNVATSSELVEKLVNISLMNVQSIEFTNNNDGLINTIVTLI
jgi:hypothetical protein